MPILDIEKLIAETNKLVRQPQQIHPDDPILVSVILHNQILQAQVDAIQNKVDAIQNKMDETLQRLTSVSDQQVERAEAISQKMLLNSADKIEKQLDTAIQRGEERLKKTALETDAKIQWASNFAWIGAVLLIVICSVFIGDWLGNTILDITHLQKSTHKQNNLRDSSPRKALR